MKSVKDNPGTTFNDYERIYKVLFDVTNSLDKEKDSLNIPMAVMIGNQSSGKSSLINAIVGQKLMATGSGATKTRRPTNLFLRTSSEVSYKIEDESFASEMEAYDKIDSLQSACEGFDSKPIKMELTGPELPTLLFVDMPGIVANEHQSTVDKMVEDMIKNERVLIVVVKKAVDDAETASAVRMAKTVDPEGIRTVMVHMKMDVIESSEQREILLKTLENQCHYDHGICLRNADTALDEKSERQFFKQSFPNLRTVDCGRGMLIKKLEPKLIRLIRENLDPLKDEVREQINEADSVLNRIGREAKSGRKLGGLMIKAFENNAIVYIEQELSKIHTKWAEKIAIMQYDLDDFKIPLDIHKPTFFIGQREFKTEVDKILELWIESTAEYIDNINTSLREAIFMCKDTLATLNKDWSLQLCSMWNDIAGAIKTKAKEEMPRLICEKYATIGFATTNHYLTASYSGELSYPDELEEKIQIAINEAFKKLLNQFKSCSQILNEDMVDFTTTIKKIRERYQKEHQEKYSRMSLHDQQTERVKSMIKAYAKVLRKTIVDNVHSAIVNNLVMIIVREFTDVIDSTSKSAFESRRTIQERKEAGEKKVRMETIYEQLQQIAT